MIEGLEGELFWSLVVLRRRVRAAPEHPCCLEPRGSSTPQATTVAVPAAGEETEAVVA